MRCFISNLPAARRAMLGVLLTCMLLPASRRAMAEDGPYDKVIRSTAWVVSPKGEVHADGSTQAEMGTAVVVDARLRLLVTCYHVVQERDTAFVFFPKFDRDGLPIATRDAYEEDANARIEGKVVARSSVKDLALIQVASLPETAVTVPLATSFPHSQQDIFAIGNSGANDNAMWRGSSGHVRLVCRDRQDHLGDGSAGPLAMLTAQSVKADMIETQVPINPGDSGGPMYNTNGELVGISSSNTPGVSLVSYAIAFDEIAAMLQSYRRDHRVAAPPVESLPRLPEWLVNPGAKPAPLPNLLAPLPELPAPLPELQPAVPTAKVTKVHDEEAKNEAGQWIGVDMNVDDALGVPCDVVVRLNDLGGDPLRSANGEPLILVKAVTPKHPHSQITSLWVYVPYNQLGRNLIVSYSVQVHRSSDRLLISDKPALGIFITPGQPEHGNGPARLRF